MSISHEQSGGQPGELSPEQLDAVANTLGEVAAGLSITDPELDETINQLMDQANKAEGSS